MTARFCQVCYLLRVVRHCIDSIFSILINIELQIDTNKHKYLASSNRYELSLNPESPYLDFDYHMIDTL